MFGLTPPDRGRVACVRTSQVLQFCAKHGILPDTVLIGPDKVNDVYKTLREGTAGLKRYVIDIGNI